jgi:hypothetical protein
VFDKTPLAEETVPLPSFSPPFQTALALRCIRNSFSEISPDLNYSVESGNDLIVEGSDEFAHPRTVPRARAACRSGESVAA